jgi:hypothetical protein
MLYVLWRNRVRDGPLDNTERVFMLHTRRADACGRQQDMEPAAIGDDVMLAV